jgi:hypothetical protein
MELVAPAVIVFSVAGAFALSEAGLWAIPAMYAAVLVLLCLVPRSHPRTRAFGCAAFKGWAISGGPVLIQHRPPDSWRPVEVLIWIFVSAALYGVMRCRADE